MCIKQLYRILQQSLLGAALLVSAGTGSAATTGSTDITATVVSTLSMTGLATPLAFSGNLATGSDTTVSDSWCVISNYATYNVLYEAKKADNSTTLNSFLLDNGSSNTIAYSVLHNDTDAAGGDAVTEGTALTAQTAQTSCGSTNTRTSITITGVNATAALPGSYSGHLHITVTDPS